jgi:hypothetical protein
VSVQDGRRITLSLPHLDGATAALLLDLCGQLQVVLWRVYGDEIDAYWSATDPEPPIYGPPLTHRR